MNKKLVNCLKFGLIGNVCFIIFSIICFYYYVIFGTIDIVVKFIEILAYTFEGLGFLFNLLAIILLCQTVRQRLLMKIGYSVYIFMEMVFMFFELNSEKFMFYKPYSLILAISHAVISTVVCFTFLSLDPKRPCLEIIVTVCAGIILFGMMGNIFGVRIYFSIFMNAIGYIVLFATLRHYLNQERIEIDCYGDNARVVTYKSTFFDE